MDSFDASVLESERVELASYGPSHDGYLQVGVINAVAKAKAKLDAIYGPNVVRANKGERAHLLPAGPRAHT